MTGNGHGAGGAGAAEAAVPPRGTLARPVPYGTGASWPLAAPLTPSVAYATESPELLDRVYEGDLQGYSYSREGHPDADRVAARIDAMEGCEGGVVTGSGMGAVSAALLGLLESGDHAIGGNQLYGRSLRLLEEDLPRLGIATSVADPADASSLRAALRPETRMVIVETISNPTLRVADVEGAASICAERGILLAVDNTFATPREFRPLEHGADIVIHSATKFLSGHSDAMLGWIGARDPNLLERLRVFAVTAGFVPSPFDCWLAERGMLTFDARFDRARATASRLADALESFPGVRRVVYPGRDDHPDRARAARLLATGGNMLGFEIEGGRAAANAFARAADGVAFAPTLGDVGTTLSHPASSSHRLVAADERERLGLGEGYFRVSVGLEDPGDLAEVFAKAVAAATGSSRAAE